jgi:hypothetical protein
MSTDSPAGIKDKNRWIPAGEGFRRAMLMLSDGAFKLFAHICLEADSRTGFMEATYKQLAVVLGKSKRSIGLYVEELSAKNICSIKKGENQYCKTIFEIRNDYWPYERSGDITSRAANEYVSAIRDIYLGLACTTNRFSSTDIQTAKGFEHEGVPLEIMKHALLLGAIRKYLSMLNGKEAALIGSLKYFTNIVDEIREHPFPEGYSQYLERENRRLTCLCIDNKLIRKETKRA